LQSCEWRCSAATHIVKLIKRTTATTSLANTLSLTICYTQCAPSDEPSSVERSLGVTVPAQDCADYQRPAAPTLCSPFQPVFTCRPPVILATSRCGVDIAQARANFRIGFSGRFTPTGFSFVPFQLPLAPRVSFRPELNTRSMWRFNARMTPIRANMVGPPSSARRSSASIAACRF
jgi:hypothetical protein